ncbi:MAG: AraC family transcriptional regulator [Spirochaetota bacterium]
MISHRHRDLPFFAYASEKSVRIDAHSHDFFEFTYIVAGSGRYCTGLGGGRFTSNDIIVTPPADVHSFVSDRGITHRQISIAVYPDLIASLRIGITPSRIAQLLGSCSRISIPDAKTLFLPLFNSLHAEFSCRAKHAASVIRLDVGKLLLLIDRANASPTDITGRLCTIDDVAVKQAIVFIEEHRAERNVMQALAAASGLPKRSLAARFKKATGLSIREHLLHVRLEKSRELLTRTDMPIGHAAYESGFSDIGLFNRQFKRHTGMSPREYRRRHAVK